MSASFTVAPSAARPTAALRRSGARRANAARVVRRGVVAEAIQEPKTHNTTKSEEVRHPTRRRVLLGHPHATRTRFSRVDDVARAAMPRRRRRRDLRFVSSRYDTISKTNNRGRVAARSRGPSPNARSHRPNVPTS